MKLGLIGDARSRNARVVARAQNRNEVGGQNTLLVSLLFMSVGSCVTFLAIQTWTLGYQLTLVSGLVGLSCGFFGLMRYVLDSADS
ncbi:MAG: hypothetical protein AAFX93_13245 [Verrucomicrobiota bacterium]